MKSTNPFWTGGRWEFEKVRQEKRNKEPSLEKLSLLERIRKGIVRFFDPARYSPDERLWGSKVKP